MVTDCPSGGTGNSYASVVLCPGSSRFSQYMRSVKYGSCVQIAKYGLDTGVCSIMYCGCCCSVGSLHHTQPLHHPVTIRPFQICGEKLTTQLQACLIPEQSRIKDLQSKPQYIKAKDQHRKNPEALFIQEHIVSAS